MADDLLDLKHPVFICDVRSDNEFRRWKLAFTHGTEAVNLPYFLLLEEGGSDDIVECVKACQAKNLFRALPLDKQILTVCAKGGTADLIAEGLRECGYQAVNLKGGMQAWGAYYRVQPVNRGIWQVSRPARGCLSYIVESCGEVAIIDPLRDSDKYLTFIRQRGLKLNFILDTHGHADHISGGPRMAELSGAPYFLHPYDAIHPIDLLPAAITYSPLYDNVELTLGNVKLRALHIPGHTLGNTALLLDQDYLFSGDSIFLSSVSRPDLGGRGESWAALHRSSLQKLLGLPGNIHVLPGHYSDADEPREDGVFIKSLESLRGKNEGLDLACRSQQEFVAEIMKNLPSFPPEYIEIKRVNLGLSVPEEEQVAELELGKNLCAVGGSKSAR